MVECNIFELKLKLKGGNRTPLIEYMVRTDLPPGTFVIVSCDRKYLDNQGSDSLWAGYNDRLTIVELLQEGCQGIEGTIDILKSDREARSLFNRINRPPFVRSPVSDVLTISCIVGGRQRLKEFGRNNANLAGAMVTERGDLRVVRVSGSLDIPMPPELQPTAGALMEDDDDE